MAYTMILENEKDVEENVKDLTLQSKIIELLNYLKMIKPDENKPVILHEKDPRYLKILPQFISDKELRTKLTEFFGVTKINPAEPKKTINWNKLKIKFGTGSRDNRGIYNTGNLLEEQINTDLETYLAGNDNYILDGFIEELSKNIDLKPIVKINAEGGLNKKRNLKILPEGLILGIGNKNIGGVVTDITLSDINNKKHYLSVKKGGTVSFANLSIAKCFGKNDFLDKKLSRPMSDYLLDFFGIDKNLFLNNFIDYYDYLKHENKTILKPSLLKDVSGKINIEPLQEFIEQIIGYGYIYCHYNKNKWNIFEMTKEKMKNIAEINGPINVYYSASNSKLVRVVVECRGINLNFSLRNRQGGVIPKSLVVNYKLKKE